MSISLDDQIKAVKREIGLRERVYPRWVSAGRMPQAKADFELDAMRAVLVTLEAVMRTDAVYLNKIIAKD